ISGTLRVLINNSGRAVDETITLPALDGPAETVRVLFTSTAKVEVFEAGVDEFGQIDPNSQIVISAADVVTLSGTVRFTRLPNNQVEVDIPDASVTVNNPDDGSEIFGVSGAARFFFGGGQGFQLQDLRVTGYSIFGAGATIPTPASALRPPSAMLVDPFSNVVLDVTELNNRGYIDVVYNDVNRVGLNEDSITDNTAEFVLLGPGASSVTVNGAATKVTTANNDRTFRYTFTGSFDAGGLDKLIEIQFLANTYADTLGANNAVGIDRFFIKATPPAPGELPPPTARLANPFSGAEVSKQSISAKRYIDVTFLAPGGGTITGINGDEIKLSGAGAANLDLNVNGTPKGTPLRINATTYRYGLAPKANIDVSETFLNGEVIVEFVAATWAVQPSSGNAIDNARASDRFTVSSTTQDAAAATNAIAIGPLSLEGPSVGLAGLGFKDGELVVTIGIGVDVAKLNFGGSGQNQTQPSAQQSSSGITAELQGVLGTFDLTVDILGLISGEGGGVGATGKFTLEIASLNVTVPNVVIVNGTGIRINYDPAYDPAENNGLAQELVVVNTASITFPSIGITGEIAPFTDDKGTTSTSDDVVIPGLVIRDNGFILGQAQLIFGKPLPAAQPGQPAATQAQQTTPGAAISIAGILELKDIRIGVQNFEVVFGQSLDFDGNIFIASGGAKFFPGKPISAEISDRLTAEPNDLPGKPDTEALRATLEFENGKVKAFVFSVDTFKVTLGTFVTLTGRDFFLDTGAADNETLVSFAAVGAEVKVGSLLIGGEARNFGFLGDGTFFTKPGFGVFLSVGSANGESFKWPKWLPIKINEIGIEWPDIQADPGDFLITLSASITGLQGTGGGLEFSGTVEGIKIDVGLLLQGKFPIVDIASLGVSVRGNLFGGELNATLIGGIVKLDAGGRLIDTFDRTTPVAERIFFVGVEGGFEFSGVGGLTIRFAMSELGPLGVFINASVPGGILLEPNTGLSINDFSAGVEFFKTLPSIEDPFELRQPAFDLPTNVTPESWLASVKQQVVTQFQLIKANPNLNGFTAAFTSPMIITGGAKIFSIYTSKELFNGEIVVRFSTDGKFLVIGKLNFAADNISISGKLYADLSKVASGDVTVLFLADIPDQVRLLTIHGKLKMGFRNASGEEVAFTVLEPATADATQKLAGPRDGGAIGAGALNGRGYIDVVFPTINGGILNLGSVTDLSPEFILNVPVDSNLRLDGSQAPVHLQGDTFRFWTQGAIQSGTATITFLRESFFYDLSTGEKEFNANGAFEDADGALQNGSPDAQSITLSERAYIDIKFLPSAGASVDETVVQSIVNSAVGIFRVERDSSTFATPAADPTVLGGGIVRFYFDGVDFTPGAYQVVFEAGAWQDSLGVDNAAAVKNFEVVTPAATVVGPFTIGETIDVAVLNSQTDDTSGQLYIDVTFKPAPGAGLDYASILDAGAEFELRVGGNVITVAGAPTPIALDFNDDFVLEATEVTNSDDLNGDSNVDDADLEILLANEGIQRFRYQIDAGFPAYAPGEVEVEFLAADANTGEGWFDGAGNGGFTETQAFVVEGPTADLAKPGDGADVDVSEINARNFIDVTFPAAPNGFSIDFASIADLGAEIALGGDGLGNVTLDNSQAPVLLSNGDVRYWINGEFVAGDVTVTFLPQTWSFKADLGTANGTQQTIALTSATFLSVTFDDAPAGFAIDPASILDLGDELILTPPAGKTVNLDTSKTPTRVGDTNTYRFRIIGDHLTDGSESVTVDFIDQSWSFTDTAQSESTDNLGDLTATNDRTYLDVTFTPTRGSTIDPAQIDGDEFTLAGPGVGTIALDVGEAPVRLSGDTYRFFLTGAFEKGAVEVVFDPDTVTDEADFSNLAATQGFTVQGPTVKLAGPNNGGAIGIQSINNRGFIDVQIVVPAGKQLDVDSVTDEGPEFTISAPSDGSIVVDDSETPVLLGVSGNTYTFRYFVTGTYTSGNVELSFIADSYELADGTPNAGGNEFLVSNPST
ncbi:MAG TPA: hypothetical protein VF987_07795, partial [Rhodospirillales bacterium]